MISTNLIYSFSQTVLDSSKQRSKKSLPNGKEDADENLIVEEYEGYCEDCAVTDETPKCPICAG